MKNIPIDIWTSLNYKDWISDFFWPINNHETCRVRYALENSLITCYRNERHELCEKFFAITFNRLIMEFLSLFESLIVVERFEQCGIIPDAKDQHSLWRIAKDLLEKGIPDRPIFFPGGYRKNYKQTIKRSLHSFSNNLQKIWIDKNLKISNYQNGMSFFLTNSLTVETASLENNFIKNELVWKWFPQNLNGNFSEHDDAISSCAGTIMKAVTDTFLKHGLNLKQPQKEYILKLTFDYLKQTANYYVRNLKKSRIPKYLWAGSGHNYYTRLLGTLVQDKGGILTCSEHGEPKSMYNATYEGYGELGVCKRFVVYTTPCAELYEKSWNSMIRLQDKAPEFVCSPHGEPVLRDVFEKNKKQKISLNQKKVLYVAASFDNNFTHVSCRMSDMVALEWQNYLFKTLKSLGYEVACKYHPEGVLIGYDFKPNNGIEYCRGVFEDYLDRDNILIFNHPGSTAFVAALCSNRPIVLISDGLLNLHKEVDNSLRERCEIIEGYYDKMNRFRVDKAELDQALENSRCSKNFGFIETYLIPDSQIKIGERGFHLAHG